MALPKETIGVRVPPEWIEKLKSISEQTGVTQSDLLQEAIGQYLNEDVSGICDRIQKLERDVTEIKRRLVNMAAF